MKQTSLMRRVLIGAAGLMVGTVGALALAGPAQAGDEHHKPWNPSNVEFFDHCDVTWVAITAGEVLENYTWTITAENAEPIAVDLAAGESYSVDLPADAGEIVVDFEGSPDGEQFGWPKSHTWSEENVPESEVCQEDPEDPEDPGEPGAPPEDPGPLGEATLEFDCEEAVLSLTNTTEEDTVVTAVPSEGDAVEVTVPAEGEESVTFPSSEGLTVDVQIDGESVLEGGAFEISSADWDDLACEDEGTGGELPVTGSSTTLIAGGAVLLLAVGGGLFLVARRRRVTFTA